MTFKLTIECDNAAFDDNAAPEVSRILEALARTIRDHSLEAGDSYSLRDVNGNTVGKAVVKK